MAHELMIGWLLLVSFVGSARATDLDLIHLARSVVNEVYLTPFDLGENATLVIETDEFGAAELPRSARVVVRRRDPCSAEDKPEVLLEVRVAITAEGLSGFSATGAVLPRLRAVEDQLRLERMRRSIAGILRVSGWKIRIGPTQDPRDPSRDAILFSTGDQGYNCTGFFDRASGLPLFVGIPY